MRCPCGFLCLLAIPLVLGAGTPAEPMRKEFLQVIVRTDSGSARQFTVENKGFRIGGALGRALERPAAANDTLSIIGSGTVELVSADSGKTLSVDVWLVGRAPAARYTGRVVKIHRNDWMAPYYVTSR